MNIKEIVEGMTAPQVAQVIKDNFNEVDKDKANKTDVNASIAKLTETDGKLSELGSKVENISKNIPDVDLFQGFVTIDGTISQNENYKYTSPIKLRSGYSVVCVGFADSIVSVISELKDGKYYSVSQGLGENNKAYIFSASEDTQVVVSSAYIDRWGTPSIYVLEDNALHNVSVFLNGKINAESEKTIDVYSKKVEQSIVEGEYVSSDLSIKQLSAYNRTAPIPLSKGEEIYLSGYVDSIVSAITLCDSSGVTIESLAVGLGKDGEYSYIAKTDCYVIISYAITRGEAVYRIKRQKSLGNISEKIDGLQSEISGSEYVISPNVTAGYYININAGVTIISSGAYSITEPIYVGKGKTLSAVFSAQPNVIAISETDDNSDIEKRSHKKLVVGLNDTLTPLEYQYKAEKDCYVEISFVTAQGLKGVKIKDGGMKESIQNVENKISGIESIVSLLSVFSKVLFIGDSLTQGAYYGEPYISKIGKNFPNMFCRMGNVGGNNEGYSGIDAKTWWETKRKSSYEDYDLIILWLGTNNGLTDTLQNDVNSYDDYNNFADTNTGCYCKIIEDIKSSNPSANIVMLSCFASSGNVDVTNKVLKEISQKYDAPIFDTSWLSLSNDTSYSYHAGTNNVHLGIYGAFVLSKKLWEFITNYYTQNWIKLENGISAEINPTNWVYINR